MLLDILSVIGDPVGGFEKVANENIMFGLLVSIILCLGGVIIFLYKRNDKMGDQLSSMKDCYSNRIDDIRKEHTTTLENIRVDMLKREEDRNRQWVESEKETLNVLNGVSMILEMGEKADKYDTEKIMNRIETTEQRIIDRINSLK